MYLRSTLWLLALLFPFFTYAATPTTPPSNFGSFGIDGNRASISFSSGNGSRRIIIARANAAVSAAPTDGVDYNYDNEFGMGDEIATDEFVVYDGVSNSTTIYDLQPNTTYYFRIFEYNGSGATTEYLLSPLDGMVTTLSAPDVQASGLTASDITGFSLDLSWTRGNGDRCIILVKAGSAVDANPTDLTTYSSSSYGFGSQIGTGNYIVYNSTGTSSVFSNLQPGITYHFAIYEYNGSSGPLYLLPAHTASFTTATTPSVPASGLSFNSINGSSFNLGWTKGDGARRMIVGSSTGPVTAVPVDGQDYPASSAFGNGTEISPGEFVVYNGPSTATTISNLQPEQTYYFTIFEYNGTDGGNTYYLTAATESGSQSTAIPPTVNASGFTFTNIAGTSMTISWTPGDGNRRLLMAREGSAVDYTPTHLETFSASTNFSAAGSVGNDNRALYSGTSSSVNIIGLQPGVTYHFTVFEYNGSSGPVYLTPGASSSQMTDDSPPGTAASNLSASSIEGDRFSLFWTNGNGSRRIVVARAGSPVSATPVDGMSYSGSAEFGSGDDLGSGEYVVYDGAGSSMTLYGLAEATTYYIRIYEYFGTGTYTIYQTSIYPELTQSTVSAPTTSATMTFSNITGNSMQVNFNGGDGGRRLVLAKAGSAVDGAPTDLNYYTGNSNYGSASYNIGGGNYIIYVGNGNSVTLTGLSPGITYHFKTFEHNGFYRPIYEVSPPDFSQATLSVPPGVQAGNLSTDFIAATQMRISWTTGDGSRRIVLAREGSAVDATPSDNTGYSHHTTFGTGDEIGTGNFVVYDGTSTSTFVYGLDLETEYHFAVFEYNGADANAYYLRPGATVSATTISPPTLAPSNLTASSVSSTSTQIGWTNGNGDGRMLVVSEGAPLDTDPVSGTGYTASSNFSSGTNSSIGNGKVTYLSTGTSITISGLQSGTTYYYSLFEYTGTTGSPSFLLSPGTVMHTTPGPPQTAASDLMINSVDGTTVSIEWTPGSGQKRLVLMRADGSPAATPSNGTDYTPNSAFGAGSMLGTGNYVVYEGAGNSAVITNLDPTTTYHLEVYEFNFSGSGTRYLLTGPASQTFSTTVLPVECIDFQVSRKAEGAQLQWTTATELNNEGFSLQRSTNGIDFTEIAWIDGQGTTNTESRYFWTDVDINPGTSYYYRLIQYDWDGQYEQACDIISLTVPDTSDLALKIGPNPFAENLNIHLSLPEESPVQISVYDLNGRKVQHRPVSNLPEGNHQFIWDGRQGNGEHLPAGIYLLRLQIDNRVFWERISKQ